MVMALQLAACTSAAGIVDDAGPPAPRFQALYDSIFGRRCVMCHKPQGLFPYLDLSSADSAYHALLSAQPSASGVCVGAAPIVIPGDCARSLLYIKLLPSQQPCGSRMPLRDVPLDDDSIDAVCRWIRAGAPD
jgi:hypothetical protein